jgi:hypothetical protein
MENGPEIGAWARNLLNDQYIITVFDGVAQSGTVSGNPSQPRTYGGLVRFRFQSEPRAQAKRPLAARQGAFSVAFG